MQSIFSSTAIMKETTKSRNNYKQQKEFYGT